MSHEFSAKIFSIFITGIILGILSSLCIAAIIVSDKDGNNTCIGEYNGINFSYSTYLQVFGWTGIAFCCLIIIGVIIVLFDLNSMNMVIICGSILAIFGTLFEFSWYIIGAIMYFQDVNGSCGNEQMIHQFGLALFIICTISWGFACCSSNTRSINDSNV